MPGTSPGTREDRLAERLVRPLQPRHLPLHEEHFDLLNTLGRAASLGGDLRTFRCQSMSGYPFEWVSHPGLHGGISVIGTDVLLALDHIGLLRIANEDNATGLTVTLTDDGLAQYIRNADPLSQRAG